jgi:hypothetical protein
MDHKISKLLLQAQATAANLNIPPLFLLPRLMDIPTDNNLSSHLNDNLMSLINHKEMSLHLSKETNMM